METKNKIVVKKLSENIWHMDDAGAVGYVVVGKDKALVIDTMNGSENVYDIVRDITDKPLVVVNTHSHPDHIGGNCFFDAVYMHENDVPFIDYFTPDEKKANLPTVSTIKEGDIIDIGEATFEVYELFGHTPGSICLLYKEKRILFTGDAINRHIWMQLDGCISLKDYLVNLHRIDELKTKADYILHGHTRDFDPITLMADMERGMQELVDQKESEITDKDDDYNWFGGVAKIHVYDDKGSAICYRKTNIK